MKTRADLPAPVLSSAVLCCLYEGWAASEQDAERLIATGRVKLVSAQSYGVVTPLAAVISGSTALVEVGDPTGVAWSLLGSGAGPQLRFGSRDPAILDRMKWRDSILAPALDTALRGEPVDLLPLARRGLDNGDDLHARTTAASAALYERIVGTTHRCVDPYDAAADAAVLPHAVDGRLSPDDVGCRAERGSVHRHSSCRLRGTAWTSASSWRAARRTGTPRLPTRRQVPPLNPALEVAAAR